MSERWAAEAEYLLRSELLNETLAGMERDALERAVNAPSADDEMRRIACETVRAIRQFRTELEAQLRTQASRKDSSALV